MRCSCEDFLSVVFKGVLPVRCSCEDFLSVVFKGVLPVDVHVKTFCLLFLKECSQ